MRHFLAIFVVVPFCASAANAPPPGIPISERDRTELGTATKALKKGIDDYDGSKHALLPDIIIFYNAVRYALDDNMFYQAKDVASARKLLALGQERLTQLRLGKHPWTTATGNSRRRFIVRM